MRMFWGIQQSEGFGFVCCNWFVLGSTLLGNGDEPKLILPKFAQPLYFFFSSGLAAMQGTCYIKHYKWCYEAARDGGL